MGRVLVRISGYRGMTEDETCLEKNTPERPGDKGSRGVGWSGVRDELLTAPSPPPFPFSRFVVHETSRGSLTLAVRNPCSK